MNMRSLVVLLNYRRRRDDIVDDLSRLDSLATGIDMEA